jgi:hypothetical protein
LISSYVVVNDLGIYEYSEVFDSEYASNETDSYGEPECTAAPGGEPDSGGSRTSVDPYWELSYDGESRLRTELVDEFVFNMFEVDNYSEVYSTWDCDRYVEESMWEEYDNITHGRVRPPNTGFNIGRIKGYRTFQNRTPEADEADWRADWRWEEQLHTDETRNPAGTLIERNFELTTKYTGSFDETIHCKETFVYSVDDDGNTFVQITRTTDDGRPWNAVVSVQDPVPYTPASEDTFIEWCSGWDALEIIDEEP